VHEQEQAGGDDESEEDSSSSDDDDEEEEEAEAPTKKAKKGDHAPAKKAVMTLKTKSGADAPKNLGKSQANAMKVRPGGDIVIIFERVLFVGG
jgi:hypothetical protein